MTEEDMTLITRSSNTTDLPENPYFLLEASGKEGTFDLSFSVVALFLFAVFLVSACVSVGTLTVFRC